MDLPGLAARPESLGAAKANPRAELPEDSAPVLGQVSVFRARESVLASGFRGLVSGSARAFLAPIAETRAN
jgi:hypothetical protein